MFPPRFISMALGLFFISLAVGNSVADTEQVTISANPTNGRKVELVDQEVLFDGVPTAAVRSQKLGGRKMMLGGHVLSNDIMEQEAARSPNHGEVASFSSSSSSSKISGMGKKSSAESLGRSHKSTTGQGSSTKQFADPRTNSLDSNADNETESQKLIDEISNMMVKDYHGNQPRRKPPINNHEPVDNDDVNP